MLQDRGKISEGQKVSGIREGIRGAVLKQGPYEERDVRQTLDLAWEMVSILPREELIRVTEKQISRYYAQKKEGASV